MEVDIPIPSPSFLHRSPLIRPVQDTHVKKQVKPRNTVASKPKPKPTIHTNGVHDAAITKPKQSKSRNGMFDQAPPSHSTRHQTNHFRTGCQTCKKKRLKCDESKPFCQQCAKRNVQCEGYRKDYKWRSFEDTSFTPSKPPVKSKVSVRSHSFSTSDKALRPSLFRGDLNGQDEDHKLPASWSPGLDSAFASAAHAIQGSSNSNASVNNTGISSRLISGVTKVSPLDPRMGDFPDGLDPYSLPNTTNSSVNEESGRSSTPTFSSGSPNIRDLVLPGTDLNSPPDPSELRPPLSPLPYQPGSHGSPIFEDDGMCQEDFDEEIFRPDLTPSALADIGNEFDHEVRQPSPAPSVANSTSSRSSNMTILARPFFSEHSIEMLTLRFDQETCGILSIKDGPHENPWRAMIWPLGQDAPALWHAINAMTAFHGTSRNKSLQVTGMSQMRQSLKMLSRDLHTMRLDAALATALALSFSEGWDQHIVTGIQHLKGAHTMVKNAVVRHRQDAISGVLTMQDAMRTKFLCNTYVYMDVIARLTSLDESKALDLDEIVAEFNPLTSEPIEVDPLMGCAVDLFPIIGDVARLVQRIRKTNNNNLKMIGEANELKQRLECWQPPPSMMFENPEDPDSDVQHCLQTAEAYRYATLLYLHQAVPEMPSAPSYALAREVLFRLASVPDTSRTNIVQIFPLLAAGCEMTSQEDRHWVIDRWHLMRRRLRIGNVVKCIELVVQVWDRRDGYEAEKQERLLRRYAARGVSNVDFPSIMLNNGKRRAQTDEALTEEAFFGEFFDDLNDDVRPLKRRVTFDAMDTAMPMPMMLPNGIGRMPDLPNDRLEVEYSVRGKLHWLGVMEDNGWEGMLHLESSCCGHRALTFHAVQYFLDDDLLLFDLEDDLSFKSIF